jgi:hypothetical protein
MSRCGRCVAFLHCIDGFFRGSTDIGDQVDLKQVSRGNNEVDDSHTFNRSRGAVQVREIAPEIPPAVK